MREKAAGEEMKGDGLTRRKAIKRIAAILATAYVGPKVLGQTPEASAMYSSFFYPDSVYGSYSGGYYSIEYYSSHSYHSIYVPPPGQ
jgi:hypothetical protein